MADVVIERVHTCGHCSATFVDTRKNKAYCSSECFRNSRNKKSRARAKKLNKVRSQARPWREHVCERCGEVFSTQLMRERVMYCSERCCTLAHKARRKHRKASVFVEDVGVGYLIAETAVDANFA